MTGFKERLGAELIRVAEARRAAAPADSRPARTTRTRRRLVLAGAGVGAVAVGIAATLLATSAGSSPAYAVTTHGDGTVVVEIFNNSDLPGLERKLNDLGIRSRVYEERADCTVPYPKGDPATYDVVKQPNAGKQPLPKNSIRLRPGAMTPGRTLIVSFQSAKGMASVGVTAETPPSCVPISAARPGR